MCEAGATPQAPSGVAPNPIISLAPDTAIASAAYASPISVAGHSAVAVLTTFEGEALFHLIGAAVDLRVATYGGLSRFRRGSRSYPWPGQSS